MKHKKIFIAIAFGTSVRDVLRNDTFEILKNNTDLDIVIFAQDIESDLVLEFVGKNIFYEKLHSYKPSFMERIISNFHRAVLRDKCRTIDLGNTGADTKTLDKFTPLARFVKKLFGYTNINRFIYWLYHIFTQPKLYKDVFDKYKPDLVVVTRVLNFSMDYPLMRRAAKENVPIVALVSSWDNLTSKGYFPFSINSLVVWNHVMKEEAVDLFNFPEDKIVVSGIPRYDSFFNNSGLADKETFCRKFDLDPSKKIIVYGTGSRTTGQSVVDVISPEPDIAKLIADHISNNRFSLPTQLMIRLHPQADPDQYRELMDCKHVRVHVPGNKTAFQDRLFSRKDDCELAETMKYADVVVNLASTLTIDAAVFDTPIICVDFDVRGERPYAISPRRFYEFDHYAKLKTTGGFVLANSKEHLIEQIDYALQNPDFLKENRKKIVDQQCVYIDGKSGERIGRYITNILNAQSYND